MSKYIGVNLINSIVDCILDIDAYLEELNKKISMGTDLKSLEVTNLNIRAKIENLKSLRNQFNKSINE